MLMNGSATSWLFGRLVSRFDARRVAWMVGGLELKRGGSAERQDGCGAGFVEDFELGSVGG